MILVNSNPATIMTDPESRRRGLMWSRWSGRHRGAKSSKKSAPTCLLPTMGGQTALNCALDLAREGVLARVLAWR